MLLLSLLLLAVHVAALATRPPGTSTAKLLMNYIPPATITNTAERPDAAEVTVTTSATILVANSALITIAPLSRNPLELRQKCFDDQGFDVDCATWTGYYYTWGGAGHPYAGGPGDDGSSGSGFNYVGAGAKPVASIVFITFMTILMLIWLVV